jgi:hypothetical protein
MTPERERDVIEWLAENPHVAAALEKAHAVLTTTPMGPGVWGRQEKAVAVALLEAQADALERASSYTDRKPGRPEPSSGCIDTYIQADLLHCRAGAASIRLKEEANA